MAVEGWLGSASSALGIKRSRRRFFGASLVGLVVLLSLNLFIFEYGLGGKHKVKANKMRSPWDTSAAPAQYRHIAKYYVVKANMKPANHVKPGNTQPTDRRRGRQHIASNWDPDFQFGASQSSQSGSKFSEHNRTRHGYRSGRARRYAYTSWPAGSGAGAHHKRASHSSSKKTSTAPADPVQAPAGGTE